MSDEIKNKQFYVTMTDKFMSGWGQAAGKTNKLVIGCDNYEQVRLIAKNAKTNNSFKFVNISSRKPYYKSNVYVSYKDFNDLSGYWKEI